MSDLTRAVSEGHYAKKQVLSKDWLISWSHRARFEVGLRLAREYAAGRRVLDYGCGDGSFLAMLTGECDAATPRAAVGAELSDGLVEDCRRRLGGRGPLDFLLVAALEEERHRGAYDLVVCMEVLEHVVDASPIVERLERVLAPGGRLIVSVPVETGLPLLVKQAARRVAGWRGIGDYPGTSGYTLGELWAGVVASTRQHITRPVHTADDGTRFHDHKGFNWMRLRETLAESFHVERTFGSPVAWLPPHLGSQAWFVLRSRS
ncbi:MAG: class I SAM-dependent methyltransferase [Pyrinomonadaceae bacterium]